MTAVVCEGVRKEFREGSLLKRKRPRICAISGVTFQVKKGEIFGIIGPNGSGKSTLIRILATLLIPDQGRVEVFGIDVVRKPLQVRRMINRVSVDAAFFKGLSPWENLRYAARLYGLNPKEAKERSLEILKRLGFPEARFYDPIEDLSRGQQQKIAITRALLTKPVLLLLDEPTTGLDPKSKLELQGFIKTIRSEHDVTIIITSHDMSEVEMVCDRVAIIDQGRILALGSPRELIANYGMGNLEEVFLHLAGKEFYA
ncbi:ABC transporter ATP-binding protein [candidate division WOR-3 bacterium]|uniref:ABC transporter ATP-binding protein n=1 Tax=candidate division WOR-3 bacterium TaxID=2052148 RepID=A0A660SF89_UNCW3|nr:MAG: ABC transporter ATP-binding protein [candidate division WOR-3 bacterium]